MTRWHDSAPGERRPYSRRIFARRPQYMPGNPLAPRGLKLRHHIQRQFRIRGCETFDQRPVLFRRPRRKRHRNRRQIGGSWHEFSSAARNARHASRPCIANAVETGLA